MIRECRFDNVGRLFSAVKRAYLFADLSGRVTIARIVEESDNRSTNLFRGNASLRDYLGDFEPGKARGDCGLIVSDGNGNHRNALHEGFKYGIEAGVGDDDSSYFEEIELWGVAHDQRIAGKRAKLFGAEAAAERDD